MNGHQQSSARGLHNDSKSIPLLVMASWTMSGSPSINPHMWNGPRCKGAIQSISPHEDGAVICPAYLRGDRPLASMKSAKQVAGSRGRALCASRVSASPVWGTRPVVHRLLCTSLLPATASQLVSAALRSYGHSFSLNSCGISVDSALCEQSPDRPSDLIGKRNGHNLEGATPKHVLQP